jgi:hypothetical protein
MYMYVPNNSVAFSPQVNYTNWVTATSQWILVPTFVDGGLSHGQHGWTPTAVNLFSRLELLLFFQVVPHLSSWGWVNPVPDPLLLRKSGSAENRTQDLWVCSQELDHRTTEAVYVCTLHPFLSSSCCTTMMTVCVGITDLVVHFLQYKYYYPRVQIWLSCRG